MAHPGGVLRSRRQGLWKLVILLTKSHPSGQVQRQWPSEPGGSLGVEGGLGLAGVAWEVPHPVHTGQSPITCFPACPLPADDSQVHASSPGLSRPRCLTGVSDSCGQCRHAPRTSLRPGPHGGDSAKACTCRGLALQQRNSERGELPVLQQTGKAGGGMTSPQACSLQTQP